MSLSIIPDVVSGQTIQALEETSTVQEAAQLMAAHNISAVVVLDDRGHLIGIATERDMARQVVAQNRLAADTRLGDIMTREVQTIAPQANALEALEQMRRHRIRHLPVVEEHRVVGVVSMRDLRQTIAARSAERPRNPVKRVLRNLAR